MRRIKITFAYDGAAYHGWQVQPGQATIQLVVERVVSRIEGKQVSVSASGRTDSGVHALAQVATFSIDNPIPLENLKKAMNRFLPTDIRVLAVEEVPAWFHARFSAKSKTYRYRIWREEICPPFDRLYVHHYPYALDETAMAFAAKEFIGSQDFTAFEASNPNGEPGKSKVRRIYLSELKRSGSYLIYQVTGSGFLKHMVRNLVGTLLEVGKGNMTTKEIKRLLTHPEQGNCGATSPASGLFLVSVDY